MRERDLEARCGKRVKRCGGQFVKLIGTTGLPDRMILLPGGRIFFVEFKTPIGRLSKMQKWWLRQLHKLEFNVFVVRSEDHFIELLDLVRTVPTGVCTQDALTTAAIRVDPPA